jgi:hypothetical protein
VHARDQPCGDHAVGDVDALALQLPVQHLLHVVPFRHRQDIAAEVVHLAHGVVAGFVLFELDAPAVELLDHLVAVAGIGVHAFLVDDAVVRDRDLLRVLFRRRMAGNDRVVQSVHAHGNGAAAFDVRLFQHQHAQLRILFLGFHRRHRSARAAANDHQVVFQFNGFHVTLSLNSPCGTVRTSS